MFSLSNICIVNKNKENKKPNMKKELIIQVLLVSFGLFSILGAYFEWTFFYNNNKVQRIIRLIGRSGAKIFYILIGAILFTIAILDIIHIIDIHLLFGHK